MMCIYPEKRISSTSEACKSFISPSEWVSEWSTLWDKYLGRPPGINSRHNATFRNSLSHMYTIFLGKSCQHCGWSKGVGIGWRRHGGSCYFVYWKIWQLKPLWAQGGQRRNPVSAFLVHKRLSAFLCSEIFAHRCHVRALWSPTSLIKDVKSREADQDPAQAQGGAAQST